MKNHIFTLLLLTACYLVAYAQSWQAKGDKIKTLWADKIDPEHPLPEYPRPELVRKNWLNLNGLWEYAILPKGHAVPVKFDGNILVPFAVESALSGVQKTVGEQNELWYKRSFTVPADWKNKQILLNFGAADWKADIWINDLHIGSHTGGYTPFCFNITPYLLEGKSNTLIVRIWDPTDQGFQPRGKQVSQPGGIWYTSVTGIWQTVWIEPVTANYITNLRTVPDIDNETVKITVLTREWKPTDRIEVKLIENGKTIATCQGIGGHEILLSVPNARLWSPETPFLYDIDAVLLSNGKPLDEVKSYTGMRKISTHRDANGIVRLQLNNKYYFQFGPLDQGWWPDGLYTAPTDEALRSDIVKTKEFGFNLIRKHVKVEPSRWYYHCDREGILVWQDMPSGDASPAWQMENYFNGSEFNRSVVSENNFRAEWKDIMDLLISHPSIVSWVPFNEAWGQFKTTEIAEWTKAYDPSRLVNPASGGNFYPTGDILDIHHYPDPKMTLLDGNRACVQGEYGGIGLAVEGHLWVKDRNWGYVQYKTTAEATDIYIQYAEKLKNLIKTGFTAAIYTQTTDVEMEVNGFMTYDRKVVKLDIDRIRKVNQEICNSLSDLK